MICILIMGHLHVHVYWDAIFSTTSDRDMTDSESPLTPELWAINP